MFADFDVELAKGFFYPREVAPYWARPMYGAFVACGLSRLFPVRPVLSQRYSHF